MRSKRQKVSRELDVGMQGILITCNMNERKCTSEAYNLLNEYADKLYGPEKVRLNVNVSAVAACKTMPLIHIRKPNKLLYLFQYSILISSASL